jgi:hypothetical protein
MWRKQRLTARDELNALSYLDGVIRESLRLNSPVPGTVRNAVQAVEVPLGVPVQDRYGNTISSVKLAKGTTLFVRESPLLDLSFSCLPLPALQSVLCPPGHPLLRSSLCPLLASYLCLTNNSNPQHQRLDRGLGSRR